jgi:hypothetical protein
MVTKRYNGDNADLIQQIADLTKRVAALENGPQTAFTTIGRAGLLVNNDGTVQIEKANTSRIVINPVGSSTPEIDLIESDAVATNPFKIIGIQDNHLDGSDKSLALLLESGMDTQFDSSTRYQQDSKGIHVWVADATGTGANQGGELFISNNTMFLQFHGTSLGGALQFLSDGSLFIFCDNNAAFQAGGNASWVADQHTFVGPVLLVDGLKGGTGNDMGRGLVDTGVATANQTGISTATTIIQSTFQRVFQNGRAFRIRCRAEIAMSAAGNAVQGKIIQGSNSTILRPLQNILQPQNTGITQISDEWVFVNTSGADITDFINVQIAAAAGTVNTQASSSVPGQFWIDDFDVASNYPNAASLA